MLDYSVIELTKQDHASLVFQCLLVDWLRKNPFVHVDKKSSCSIKGDNVRLVRSCRERRYANTTLSSALHQSV
jgi:hypothetical protein